MHPARSARLRLVVAAVVLGLVPTAASAADRSLIGVPLSATASSPEAKGWLAFRVSGETGAELVVVAGGLEPEATYALRVAGSREGRVRSDAHGTIHARFPVGTSPDYRPPLGRDPRGEVVSLAREDGGLVLVAYLGAPFGLAGRRYEASVALSPTSLAPDGAEATAHVAEGPGERSFALVLEGLPAGRYALFVDGARRASVDVTGSASGSATVAQLDTGAASLDGRLELRGARGRVFEGELRAALPRAPSADVETVSFRVRVPDFVSKRVEGVTLWRREASGGAWRRAAEIRLLEEAGRRIWYRAYDPATGEPVDLTRSVRVQRVAGGDGRAFTLEYERPGPSARFRISTYNRVGESPRSRASSLR